VEQIKSKEINHMLSVKEELRVCSWNIWWRIPCCAERNKPKRDTERKRHVTVRFELL